MLFVIDIGNTNILLGIYDGEKPVSDLRIVTDTNKTAEGFKKDIKEALDSAKIDTSWIKGVVISSVVPSLNTVFEKLCNRWLNKKPLFVNSKVKTGMGINCENPEEVGADRIAVSVAARELYGKPVIVVDFGTAVTFDVVDENGDYAGGVIAPGIELSSKALSEKTALLPQVDVVKPDFVVGKNTVNSMQSGIVYGFLGQAREIVTRIKNEIKGSPKVIATGGYAGMIAGELPLIDREHPNLILEGLRLIWERNQNN